MAKVQAVAEVAVAEVEEKLSSQASGHYSWPAKQVRSPKPLSVCMHTAATYV